MFALLKGCILRKALEFDWKYCKKLLDDGVPNRCKILSNENIKKMAFTN